MQYKSILYFYYKNRQNVVKYFNQKQNKNMEMESFALQNMKNKIAKWPKFKNFNFANIHDCITPSSKYPMFREYIDLYLKENKDSINKKDSNGKTILILACEKLPEYERCAMIEIILKHNPDLNLQDKFGNTALYYTPHKGTSHLILSTSYSLLLDAGADYTIKNNEGKYEFQMEK